MTILTLKQAAEYLHLHPETELGGWATAAMVQRYAHLSSAHLLAYSQGIDSSVNFSKKRLTG